VPRTHDPHPTQPRPPTSTFPVLVPIAVAVDGRGPGRPCRPPSAGVGLSTSLAELVSSLAVGNLFGSNGFNMAIFAVLDLLQPAYLLAALDPALALSGLFAVVLMGLGLAALVYRAQRGLAILEPSSAAMLLTYLLA